MTRQGLRPIKLANHRSSHGSLVKHVMSIIQTWYLPLITLSFHKTEKQKIGNQPNIDFLFCNIGNKNRVAKPIGFSLLQIVK